MNGRAREAAGIVSICCRASLADETDSFAVPVRLKRTNVGKPFWVDCLAECSLIAYISFQLALLIDPCMDILMPYLRNFYNI